MGIPNRAYALLSIKSIDEDERVIEGIASTPVTDRVGDIIEPKGAEFKLPIPLLWQHRSGEPIGEVFYAKVTAEGIYIKARVKRITEPGRLKDRLDEAWQSIKYQLVRGLSIGFSPLESARIEGSYGYRFLKWLWLELSAVTIPANADASIQSIKSFDAQYLAASGHRSASSSTPAASGFRQTSTMKNYSDKISAAQKELQAKTTRLEAIGTKADAGESLTTEEQEEQKDLPNEINDLVSQVNRYKAQEAAQSALATTVIVKTVDEGTRTRRGETTTTEVKANRPPEMGFVRAVICKMAGHYHHISPIEVAKMRYPDDSQVLAHLKSAVAGATTTGDGYVDDLVYPDNLASEFVEYLRNKTILGQFGTGNIPSLRRVPFNFRAGTQTSGGIGYWVGEAKHKPVTRLTTGSVSLGFSKAAALAVVSNEAARFSKPGAESIIRDDLTNAIVEVLDVSLVDPGKALDPGVSPASITNVGTPLNSAGSNAAAVKADVKAAFGQFIAAKIGLSGGVWIMPETLALTLSMMENPLGNREFPTISMSGGTFYGLPVITSQHAVSGSPAGDLLILASAPNIFLADDGAVSVNVSTEASIKMASDPEDTDSDVEYVSMYQTNQMALLAERYANWALRRAEAVAYFENVSYNTGSPA